MEKQNIIQLLNEIFIPLGFKRKGNNWVLNGSEISKIINLQKSQYSNSFYINYGYNIKGLEHITVTHVHNRFGSIDKNQQKRITELLDLETNIPEKERLQELKTLISDKILSEMKKINTEKDLLNELKSMPNLNMIPFNVKKHFNLS